jgi:hypothetical protein
LKQLNDWKNHKNGITNDNIQTLIPDGEFFKYSVETKNDLTDHINKTIVEVLSSVEKDDFYLQKANMESDYWFIVTKHLIGTEFMRLLPENLTSFGIKMLDDIASGEFTIPENDSVLQKIIDRLEKKQTVAHIKDIRDKFCNNEYTITPEIFSYFEDWFFEQGDLNGRKAERVTHTIELFNNHKYAMILVCEKEKR